MPENLLPHLRFSAPVVRLNFSGDGRSKPKVLVARDRARHAASLKAQFTTIDSAFNTIAADRQQNNLSSEFGLTLNVVSEPDYPLAFTSLEKVGRGSGASIVLLNVRRESTPQGEVTKAAVFVPFGQLKVLLKKVEDYANPGKDKRNPANQALLANIASISMAAFDALWTDPEAPPPADELAWFEFWVRRDGGKWQIQTQQEFEKLHLKFPEAKDRLTLPEHVVIVARATREAIESSLDLLNALSEIRRARPCSVGLTDLSGSEQEEWIDEALQRIHWPGDDAPAVCLIDSGVNRGHPLIEPLLSEADSETVFADGDRSDDMQHGTPISLLIYPSNRNEGVRVAKEEASDRSDA